MLLTNFPLAVLRRGLGAFFTHELGAIRHLRATGQPELVGEILRGRRDGLKLIGYALRRRKILKPHRAVGSDLLWELMNNGTIIW